MRYKAIAGRRLARIEGHAGASWPHTGGSCDLDQHLVVARIGEVDGLDSESAGAFAAMIFMAR